MFWLYHRVASEHGGLEKPPKGGVFRRHPEAPAATSGSFPGEFSQTADYCYDAFTQLLRLLDLGSHTSRGFNEEAGSSSL